jgi:hypothetical protein
MEAFLIRSTQITERSMTRWRNPVNGLSYPVPNDTTKIVWYVAEKIGNNYYDRPGFFTTHQEALDSVA